MEQTALTYQSLNFRNALLEAHNEATPYAILIVDMKGKVISYTRQFVQLWSMPQHIVEAKDDEAALQYAMTMVADPQGFINRVQYLYKNPEETSYDEVLFKDGRIIERYGRAIIGEDGTTYGWAWHFRDITSRKKAEEEIKAKNEQLNNLYQELQFVTDTIPQLAWATEKDGFVYFFNKGWLQYTGLTLEEAKGNHWIQSLHPDDVERTLRVWESSKSTGNTYEVEYRLRRHDGVFRWFLARGTPMKDKDGNIIKWYGTNTDIQEKKEQEKELENKVQSRTAELEREKAFANSVLDASINGIIALDAIRDEKGNVVDFTIIKINKQLTAIIGLDKAIIGKSYLSLFWGSVENGIFDMYKEVLDKGRPLRKEIYSTNLNLNSWFEIAAAKRGDNGIVASIINISQQRQAALQIEEQKNLLDNILKHSPSGITVYKAMRDGVRKIIDFQCIVANDAAEEFTLIPNKERFQKTVLEITPDLKESPLFGMAVAAIEEGSPFRTEYYSEPVGRWLELSVVKMDGEHLINLFRDITPIKNTQLEIEKAAERFAGVFNASQSGMFTFAPVRDERGEIIDFRFVITNPTFAAYVGQTPEVLNGALGSTWFPGYLTNGVFDMYKKTYLTGEAQRIDIHYNVDQHDIYLDLKSTKVGDEVLVTFNDYTPLKRTQLELEKYVEDLKRSNANLEEFAYAASHDMKEPIRKIHFFSDRLKKSLADRLNEEQAHYFQRMQHAAKRMGTLIEDLLLYSFVTKGATFEKEVDLNNKIALVLEDLELEIQQRSAKIEVGLMPVVTGHRRQLQQLFHNLIGNALKYSRPNVPPQIDIICQKGNSHQLPMHVRRKGEGKEYHLIKVQDNGIGFEQKEAERIFNVFTRLHGNAEYKGSGIGLSIVQKIVENHHGYVWAESTPGQGSTFFVALPAGEY